MSETKKTTTRRKPAAKAPAERKAPARRASTKPTDKIIRNLRGVPVHLRLGPTRDPYRVQLQPRGQAGDYDTIPANLTGQLKDVGILYEVITETEARQLQYFGGGYVQREQATILREEDTVISRQEDWDGKGRQPQRDSRGHQRVPNDRAETGAGPRYADVAGADAALHEGLREGAKEPVGRPTADDMLPPGAFPQRVVIERTRG